MTEQQGSPESGIHNREERGLDIQGYLQILFKRKWLILSAIVIVLGATAVWTFSRTKIYRGTSTVIVDEKAPQVLGNQVNEVVDLSQGGYWRNKEYMETQRKVITSLALAHRVSERLQLASNDAFWGPHRREEKKDHTLDEAAEALAGRVQAHPTRDSNIIEISVEHADANLAAQLANAVTQEFMEQNVEYKHRSTSGAVRWLSDQLDELRKQLEKSELALHEFKRKNNIISVSLEDKQNILARQIEKVTDALTDVRMRRMALEAQRKQTLAAQAQAEGGDPAKIAVGQVMDNPVIQRLKEGVIAENRRFVALQEKYLEKHPLVLEQRAKLDAARRDLSREVNNVLSALEAKFRAVRDEEGQIAATLQSYKEEALGLNKREVSYQQLKRQQENTAKLYSLMLSRMKESDLSSQLRVNNIRPLDAAVVPKVPVSPRVSLNLVVGFILGLLLGIGLAFLVDALDNSVKSQDDVEQVPDLVFLGLMPRIPGSAVSRNGKRPEPKPELDLIVHRTPKSAVAESCRSIRTNLLFAAADRALNTIVVTSPGPREGKTTTAVSMAIAMAQSGARILIIDTDMRRPRMHKVFGVPGSEGITSILLGSETVDRAIKATEVPNLQVLPCGPVPPNPAEICQGDRFRALLAELGERFDRVILDSPPVMVVTDAVVLSTIVDGTLIVARTGQTTRGGLRDTVRQLRDVGGHLLGCVLNDMDLEKRGYGYYRHRRYGYSRYGYGRYGYGQYGDKEEQAPG